MKNKLKGKKILITGGLGFLGSNLAKKLVDLGADVEVFDALIAEQGGNLFNIKPISKNIRVTISDLRDQKKISRAVKKKDYIFNLAGTLSHIDSMKNPFNDLDINCRAQLFLLEACRRFNDSVKIIFAGTRNQYGKVIYTPVDENHPQEPTDINGINSIAAEKYHFLYGRIYGIRPVSLRMTNAFGPRHQMKHSRQGVLNWFIRLLMDNRPIGLFGDGSQIRDINYVDDVVDLMLAVAGTKKSDGEIYNLGGTPMSLKDFAELAIKVLGRGKIEIVDFPKDRKEIEVGNYIADITKVTREIGWKPKISVEEGIKKTIDYYLQFKKYYW